MYDYSVYGYILRSEIELVVKDETAEIVELTVKKGTEFTDEVHVQFQTEYAEMSSSFVRYMIFPVENRIHVEFREREENVICTLLNIPFSLFCLGKGNVLLHCGCVENSGELFALAADKGVGKSTLAINMAKSMNLFSDDTLRVTNELVGYGVNNFAKLSKASYEMIFGNTDNKARYEQSDGKLFIVASDVGLNVTSIDRGIVKGIYLLERRGYDHVEIRPITSERIKEILLLSNVVGISYMNKYTVKYVFSLPIFHRIVENVHFFKVCMINDVNFIAENAIALETFIRQ